jgi:signal transduction histidine kinase
MITAQDAPETQLSDPAGALSPSQFEKIEQAKREWEATADTLSELIFLVDQRGYILRANRTVEAWGLGDVKTIKGHKLHDFIHATCADATCPLASFLALCGDATQQQCRQEMEVYDAALSRYLQICIEPVRLRNGLTTLTTVVVLQDVSRRKEAERALQSYTSQLEQLYAQLEEVNRDLQDAVRAKDEMIQNVSHELRTPLTLIDGYTALLKDGTLGPLAPEQDEALSAMAENSRRLRGMVDRLLILQTLEEGKLHRDDLDLEIFLNELMTGWHARCAKLGVDLQLDIAADLSHLNVDSDLLAQVVNNLLENALKFSSPGQRITLRAYQTQSCLQVAAEHILVVADEGAGIPADKLSRIFDRFYQIDGSRTRRFGGMGIGLALCRKIVKLHGGRIWAESDGERRGSRFYVALPSFVGAG